MNNQITLSWTMMLKILGMGGAMILATGVALWTVLNLYSFPNTAGAAIIERVKNEIATRAKETAENKYSIRKLYQLHREVLSKMEDGSRDMAALRETVRHLVNEMRAERTSE